MARPTLYTLEIGDRICALIATHAKSLEKCLDLEDGLPEYRTVCRWIFNNEEFRQKYARAKELQQELKGEEIEEIADDDGKDETNPERIQRAKLRIDTRKWLMSKLAPKKYGDKTTHSNDPENPLPSQVTVVFKEPASKD